MKKKIFPSICKMTAVLAYVLMACPFASLYFGAYAEAHSALTTLLYCLGFVSLGYAVQALFGLITRFKRQPYNYTTTLKQYFSTAHIALPLLVGFVISLFMASSKHAQMTAQNAMNRYSLIPFMYGAVIFAIFTLGCVLWFFPYGKLISKANMIAVLGVFVAGYTINAVLGLGQGVFVTVCFFLYIGIAVFLINQAALERYFKMSGGISRNTRLYNLAISIVLLICILLTSLFVLGLLGGGASAVRYAARMMFDGMEREEEEVEEEEYEFVYSEGESGSPVEISASGENSTLVRVLTYIDIAVIILGGALALMMYFRGAGRLRSAMNTIKEFFRELFDVLLSLLGFRFRRELPEGQVPQSYHEEHVGLSGATTVKRSAAPAVRSYSEFKNRLEGLDTPEARYKYAYSTMMLLARSRHELKASHTPREASSFLAAQGWDERVFDETSVYELTAYSPDPPPADKLEDTLRDICGRVRAML